MITGQMDAGGLAVAVALGLVVWLPAAWVLGRRLGWSAPAVLVGAFTLAPAVVGVSATLAWLVGASLDITIALSVAGALALAGAAFRFRRGGRLHLGVQGIAVGLAAGALAFWERPWFDFTADTFYHLAAARSLMVANAPLVTDPLHGTGATALDPTSGIFHTWLAGASTVSTVGVEYIYTGFAALAAAVVTWAVWTLAERVSRSSTIATVVTLGFVAFGVWGDFRMAGMPNRFAVAFLCLALLGLIDSTYRTQRRAAGLVILAAGIAAFTTHLAAVGAFALFTLAVLIATSVTKRPTGADRTRPRFAPIALAALIAAPTLMTKIAATLSSHMTAESSELPEAFVEIGSGMLFTKPGKYIGGGPIAFALMTLIAIWALYRALKHRDAVAAVVGAACLLPAVVLSVPPVTTLASNISLYMLVRIVLMMKFLPFIAAAWALGAIRGRRDDGSDPLPTWQRWALVVAGAGLVLSHAVASWPLTEVTFIEIPDRMRVGEEHTVAETRESDIRAQWGLVAIWAAERSFGGVYPTVAASPETGYYLAGLTDVAIVAAPESHTPLVISMEERARRRGDMKRLLDPGTSESERRTILATWNAEYVVLSLAEDDEMAAWESMRTQKALFQPAVESYRLGVLRVLPPAPSE